MTEIKKGSKPLGFTLVFIGLLFFFNPYFAVIDFLPDFIGCILILCGLERVSCINRTMGEARTAFFKLLAFDLVKSIVIVIMMAITPDAERPVALLSLSFVYAIVGFYFTYGAMSALFDGFYNLAATGDCPALWTNCKHQSVFVLLFDKCRAALARRSQEEAAPRAMRERSCTEQMLRRTLVFVAIKEIVCTLPEFAALSTSTYIDSDLIRIYDHIGIMRFLAFFAVAIVGVVWLVYLCRYFALLRRQKSFREELGARYAEFVHTHPGAAVTRRYGLVFILFAFGAACLCDFYIDFKNILPDWLGAACFLLGILLTDLSRKQKLIGGAGALVFGTLTILSTRFSYAFVTNYSGAEISKTAEAASAYQLMWLMALGEFLTFLVMLGCVLWLLRIIIQKWAGYIAHFEDHAFEKRRRAAFLAEFDGELLKVFVFGFLSGLVSFLYDYIKEIPGKGIFRLLEFFWAVDFSLALVFAVVLGFTLSAIHTEIRQRFLYDA